MAYELILGSSWPAQFEFFFHCQPRMSIVFNGLPLFLLECITSTYFFLDFHVALPQRPDMGNTSTNPLPIICWWCWCSLSMAASPSKPAGIHAYYTFCYIPPPTSHLLPHHTFLFPYHTFFLVCHKKFTLFSRKSTI